MGNTANEDKRAYVSRQATIDELQAKVSALLNIEKVLKLFPGTSKCDSNHLVRISAQVSSSCRTWKRKRTHWQLRRRRCPTVAIVTRSKGTSGGEAYLGPRSGSPDSFHAHHIDSSYVQHMAKQLANAREKIERAQQHIEDKRVASQQAIERLEKEYQNMAIERRDTDKHNEELRAEADDIERKVSPLICLFFFHFPMSTRGTYRC